MRRKSNNNGTTVKTTKRYPRVTAGPLRNQYVHRVVAAVMIGRDLNKDEEVHHKDQDRLNFHFSNLVIRGHYDHGWISAKQAHFMRHKDDALKAEWDAFMEEEDRKQTEEIAAARNAGEPWQYEDGKLQQKWEERYA